ncbi:MAG TPA: sugar phosphate isomerase/epimerase [Parafilimonas sp.]|nr:sugar phosphate isomerase/epimerase [Parafilimonas sp.]
MSYSRRKFLQTTGLFAAAGLISTNNLFAAPSKLKNYGIQLWSVKNALSKDPKGVLKQLADDGYTQIESFEGSKGMFWGMSAAEFKKYMDDLGMKIISSHCDIEKDFDKKAADAASIGMKYLICPYKGPQKTADDFKKIADEFNAKGEICKKSGIRFGYHNHDYSFVAVDGQVPEDIMLANTNPELVDFEMDIYWVVTAGADPVAYTKKYKNRFRLGHVKDRIKNTTEKDASCTLGEGSIDYPSILKIMKANGMEYFIVEQERYDNTTEMDSAKADAKYMSMLSI